MAPERVSGTSAPAGGAAPRWLDADEQRTWRAWMGSARLILETLDRQLSQTADLPHTYYEILVRLSEAPGRTLRMSQLADGALVSRSRLSHAVSRLEGKGWIRRESCPNDKRGALAVLTDDGFAVLAAAAPGHVEAVRQVLFDPLDAAEVRQLEAICSRLLDGLRAREDGQPQC